MSQSGSFSIPPWEVVFGPSLCLPHLMLQGWMYKKRMLFDTGAWAKKPAGITFQLAPNTEAGSPAFLGASLSVPGSPAWDYLLEVAPLSGWNQGVANLPALMVRRTSSQTDPAPKVTAMYLGQLQINSTGSTTMTEASGNTTFTVSQISTRGPTVTVTAKRIEPATSARLTVITIGKYLLLTHKESQKNGISERAPRSPYGKTSSGPMPSASRPSRNRRSENGTYHGGEPRLCPAIFCPCDLLGGHQ